MNAPTRIGRYEIIRRLGKSMTEVYLAMDTVENRKVALKLIPHGDDRAIATGRRGGASRRGDPEGTAPPATRAWWRSTNTAISTATSSSRCSSSRGARWRTILAAEHVVDPCRAAVIALEICEQLAKFHSWESAVVHGDIKPSNIHLGSSDTVRLLDFGIAKMLRADCNATVHQFGSPSYCSPERLTRAEVDPQSDLWALGATLYEMLAGVPPYQAEDTRKLEGLIRSKRPPRALPASCPAGLRAIVMKSLAPDAGQRYRSAVEFQADLQLFLERKPTLAETERRSKWNPTATLEAAREALRRVTRTARRKQGRRLQVLGAAAYFATGMLLWIAGTVGWQLWQTRASAAARPAVKAPPRGEPGAVVRWRPRTGSWMRTAPAPIPWLYEFDWPKAEICLERAVQLGAGEDRTLAKLALARGYATLERLSGAHYSENAAVAAAPQSARRVHAGLAQGAHGPRPASGAGACLRVLAARSREGDGGVCGGGTAGRSAGTPRGGAAGRCLPDSGAAGDWRATGGGRCAMPMWRAASTGRIPGFDEADRHLRELDQIHAPAPRKPRPRRWFPWR